jgi:hypothetical protein
MSDIKQLLAAMLSKATAALCVRNTFLEELHSGTTPSSKAGDFSDVKVVTPYGEIPWQELSRISDMEMKRLTNVAVPSVFETVVTHDERPLFVAFSQSESFGCTRPRDGRRAAPSATKQAQSQRICEVRPADCPAPLGPFISAFAPPVPSAMFC